MIAYISKSKYHVSRVKLCGTQETFKYYAKYPEEGDEEGTTILSEREFIDVDNNNDSFIFVEAVQAEDYREALEIFDRLCEKNKATIFHYNKALYACRMARNFNKAKEIFERMLTLFEPTNISCFNAMIANYASEAKYTEAMELFHSLTKKYNISPEPSTYVILMTMFNRKMDFQETLNLWEDFQKLNLKPNMKIYTAYIIALINLNKLTEVSQIIEQMTDENIPIDDVLLGTIVDLLLKNASPESKELLKTISNDHMKKNIRFYNLKINLTNDKEEMKKIIEEAKANNVYPDRITYNILLKKNGSTYEECMKIYDKMLESNIKPDIVTYNAILKAATIDPTEDRFEIVQQIRKELEENFDLVISTIEILLRYYYEINRYDEVEKIKQIMNAKDKLYTKRMYTYLLKRALDAKNFVELNEYLSHAFERGSMLEVEICVEILDVFSRESLLVPFQQLFEYGIKKKIFLKNLNLYKSLFVTLMTRRQYDFIDAVYKIAIDLNFCTKMYITWKAYLLSAAQKNSTHYIKDVMDNALKYVKNNEISILNLCIFFLNLVEERTDKYQEIISELRSMIKPNQQVDLYLISKLKLFLLLLEKNPRW